MKILNLYFSAIDESQFNVIAEISNGGKVEGRSILPFFETKTKWRTTLIKILESIFFSTENFLDEERAWMLQEGLLKSDGSDFSANYLKKIGQSLYDSLFPTGKVRDLLKGAITSAGQEQLHIQIEFNAEVTKLNRLPDYPWEMVHDGDKFLVDHNITFSRCIADQSAQSTLLPVSQINVLLISSRAFDLKNGLASLSEEEHKAVREGLEKSQVEGHIRLHKPESASFKSLTTYLDEYIGDKAPHVLHFDGHGVFGKRCDKCRTFYDDLFLPECTNTKCLADLPPFQGYLLFESDDPKDKLNPNYVSSDELGRLLQSIRNGDNEAQKGGIRLAVLSACKSASALGASSVFNGVAQNLIGYGVPAVVAMQYTVSVKSATAFAKRFYQALGNKQSLAVATSKGRVAMQNEKEQNQNQWYRLIFYLRWQGNDGGQLFGKLPITDPHGKRQELEYKCYRLIEESGALVRITAPQKMGKTTLLQKVLDYAKRKGYRTATLPFSDPDLLKDEENFLKSFCFNVSCELELLDKTDEYWKPTLTSFINSTSYFEKYLLPSINSNLILAIDNFEEVLKNLNIFKVFCQLLRHFHDLAKSKECIWQNLRLVIVNSTEEYPVLDINHSPFNVGERIELEPFTESEVESLSRDYQLDEKLTIQYLKSLTKLVGGHPYLIEQAFSYLKQDGHTFIELYKKSSTDECQVFRNHLRKLLNRLKELELEEAYKKVLRGKNVILNSTVKFKLHSLGLIKFSGDYAIPACELYRKYFDKHLIDYPNMGVSND